MCVYEDCSSYFYFIDSLFSGSLNRVSEEESVLVNENIYSLIRMKPVKCWLKSRSCRETATLGDNTAAADSHLDITQLSIRSNINKNIFTILTCNLCESRRDVNTVL